MTREWYETLLAEQNGCCAICGTTDPGRYTVFCVDHDHACCPGERTCGQCVRGLLCLNCNIALGHYETWYLKNRENIDDYLVD